MLRATRPGRGWLPTSTCSRTPRAATGAIYQEGARQLQLQKFRIDANTAGGNGGGIRTASSFPTGDLQDGSITDNVATGTGGGGGLDLDGSYYLDQLTIDQNNASHGTGGGLLVDSTAFGMSVHNSTVADNTAASGGRNIANGAVGGLPVTSTIVAGASPNCSGPIANNLNNLETDPSCSFGAASTHSYAALHLSAGLTSSPSPLPPYPTFLQWRKLQGGTTNPAFNSGSGCLPSDERGPALDGRDLRHRSGLQLALRKSASRGRGRTARPRTT